MKKNRRQRLVRTRSILAAVMAAGLLGACGTTPPVHFHNLQSSAGAQPAPAAGAAAFMIEVLPVTITDQADHPQIMLRGDQGTIFAMYSDRWMAPLPDEFRAALSQSLTRELGALDVQVIKPSATAAVWRIQVDVQRFEATDNVDALVDATWRVRPLNLRGDAFICRSVIRVPTSEPGVPAAVGAQQRAVVLLASTIASAIKNGGSAVQASDAQVQLQGCTESKG